MNDLSKELIREFAARVIDAKLDLADLIRSRCPGPGVHAYVQHRDGRPPWCEACGYTESGSIAKEVVR